MRYNIYFDICALVIALVIFIEYSFRRTVMSRKTKVFLIIFSVVSIATIADICSSVGLYYAAELPLSINYFILTIYNIFFHAISPLYVVYVITSVRENDIPVSRKEAFCIFAPYLLDVLLTLSSPFTKYAYYIESDYEYVIYWGTYVSYAVAAVYMTIGFYLSIKNLKKVKTEEKWVTVCYVVMMVVCLTVQVYVPEILIINFGAMMAILFMAFTMENPFYYEDQQLNMYNREAFYTVVCNYVASQEKFYVLGINLIGITDLKELVGLEETRKTTQEIAKYFLSICDKNMVYTLSDSQFVMILTGGEAEADMYIKKIQHRFEDTFNFNNQEILIPVSMSKYSYPEDANTALGVSDMLDYSLKKAGETGKDSVVIADKKLVDERQRVSRVLSILRTAVEEKKFSVYYQPIYSVETQNYVSAEALIRLYDEELGFISPDEFIPIAERNGLIGKIGEFVLRETCRFMAENRIWEKGIEYIDVNLSPMQCIQNDLHMKCVEIMDEYRLDYSRISLEITESANVFTSPALAENMQALMNKGVRFSLDDYGTGYSNIATVIEYPFSIVKLDKSMLWNAMKSDKAMTLLRQTIRMMKQLSMQLIAEGVETDEQAQLLAYYGCDFFQGFFYAKPQNGESFLRFLDEKNIKNMY